jgi:hypothetical protein
MGEIHAPKKKKLKGQGLSIASSRVVRSATPSRCPQYFHAQCMGMRNLSSLKKNKTTEEGRRRREEEKVWRQITASKIVTYQWFHASL